MGEFHFIRAEMQNVADLKTNRCNMDRMRKMRARSYPCG